MAQSLGNMDVGSVVYLAENGTPQPYIIVNQGKPSDIYDDSCDGIWLLRQYIYKKRWFSSNNNDYTRSAPFSDLMEIQNLYDVNIINVIKNIKIPYVNGNGKTGTVKSGKNGLSTKLFLLSGREVGYTRSGGSFGDGTRLDYFYVGNGSNATERRRTTYNGDMLGWWTRTPEEGSNSSVEAVSSSGSTTDAPISNNSNYGIRPTMIFPPNVVVDDSNNVTSVIIPSISSFTVPQLEMVGQSIPLSWSAVTISGYTANYKLERNVNNGGWTTISSNLITNSYNDMAQVGWTQVQYRVAVTIAEISGADGEYKESNIIPIFDPAVLVISGADGELGTINNNIPYTVSTNTGNQISLTRSVNGTKVAETTVESGFSYSIPIADLPSGTGDIIINASVQKTDGNIETKTRTWTYNKTRIDIPSTGGIAQLTQNNQNIWPITISDAIQAPEYLGGNLTDALNKLGNSAKVEYGTYIGTGVYSTQANMRLTFSFIPKFVCIGDIVSTQNRAIFPYGAYGLVWNQSGANNKDTYPPYGVAVTWEGNSVSWYNVSSDPGLQMNSSNHTYQYVAFG